jgi:hypothetical protein
MTVFIVTQACMRAYGPPEFASLIERRALDWIAAQPNPEWYRITSIRMAVP